MARRTNNEQTAYNLLTRVGRGQSTFDRVQIVVDYFELEVATDHLVEAIEEELEDDKPKDADDAIVQILVDMDLLS